MESALSETSHPLQEDLVLEFILLAEFNEVEGKLIIGVYPENAQKPLPPKDLFNVYSDFLIPRDELCAQFIAIDMNNGYYLMTLPVVLKNKEKDKTYKRAKYFFGVTLCVRKQKFEADRLNYEHMIRKITYFFVILEQQKHAIYNLKERQIKAVLRNTYIQLNNTKQTMMNYKGKYFTFVSTCTSRPVEKVAKFYEVPLTTLTPKEIEAIDHDPLKRIMREVIFGQSCAKKISQQLDIKLDELLEYLNIGIRYGVVYMLDLFGLDNVYVLTKEIHQFARDKPRINRLKESLVKEDSEITCQQILQMYLKLRRGKTIKSFLEKYTEFFSKVSIISFIRLGIIEGIVKRVRQILVNKQVLVQNKKFIKFVNNDIYEESFQYIKKKEEASYASMVNASIQRINDMLNKFVDRNAEVDEVIASFYITRQKVKEIVEPYGIVFLQVD